MIEEFVGTAPRQVPTFPVHMDQFYRSVMEELSPEEISRGEINVESDI